jgi:poly(hydroxyalkanoate) depolymerase family esterase
MSPSLSQVLARAQAFATSPRSARLAATIERALAGAGLMPLRGGMPSPAYQPATPPQRAPVQPDFVTLRHESAHGQRDYKLYVPPGEADAPRPLIVMLHGCKQHPDDFAAGTRMNVHAQREGFLVAYPEQTRRANGANCWNWFEPAHQGRDGAEPALIAGIVGDIGATHRIDPGRVFVAGLSAGASMALILGHAYPDLFAGVAAHSGLPVGAASDVASAFAAMRGQGAPARRDAGAAVRTIVLHGDADPTVVPSNAEAIVTQAVQAHLKAGQPLTAQRALHGDGDGRARTATIYRDADGRARVESWRVHGGAHAWFGGSAEGSYTDAGGPDASAEIVRFFLRPDAPVA